jgi:hypothetical protein
MSAHRLVFGQARPDGVDATGSTARRAFTPWVGLVAVLMIAIAVAYRLL